MDIGLSGISSGRRNPETSPDRPVENGVEFINAQTVDPRCMRTNTQYRSINYKLKVLPREIPSIHKPEVRTRLT